MSPIIGDGRFKKAKDENFHQTGQKVWLVGMRVSVKRRKGKVFGVVVKDSIWPDMWSSIEVWNRDQLVDYDAKINGVKVRPKCPMRLR